MDIAGKAMEWFNRGLNQSIPNEAKASWGDLISNDIKQRGKFGKGGSLGGWDLTRGFRPGVPASEGGFMSGPTPLGREIVKRPLRALANLSPVGRLAGGLPGLIVGDLISPQPLAAGTLDEAIARGDVPKEDYDKLQEKYQKEYDDYMNPKGTDPLAPPIKLAAGKSVFSTPGLDKQEGIRKYLENDQRIRDLLIKKGKMKAFNQEAANFLANYG